jgi:hypothetical protein
VRSGRKGVIPFKRGNKEGNKRRMAQTPDEKTYVEFHFIELLKEMGWEHIKRLKVADCGRN